jgi:hypothetical protein
MFLGFLVSARLVSVMKFFDARDQLNRKNLGETIRAFLPVIKEIDVLPNGARPAGATESQRRYCAASSLLICASLAGKISPAVPRNTSRRFDTSGKSPAYLHHHNN